MIIINNPNNPTGAPIHNNVLKQIAQIAKVKGIILFSDEVWRGGPRQLTTRLGREQADRPSASAGPVDRFGTVPAFRIADAGFRAMPHVGGACRADLLRLRYQEGRPPLFRAGAVGRCRTLPGAHLPACAGWALAVHGAAAARSRGGHGAYFWPAFFSTQAVISSISGP